MSIDRETAASSMRSIVTTQGSNEARSGLAISMDALAEELVNTAELVSYLFDRLDPILHPNQEEAVALSFNASAQTGGSMIQGTVWEKVGITSRINAQLRELTSRLDV